MKYLNYVLLIMGFCFAFLLTVYGSPYYSIQGGYSRNLPDSRISNYSVGENGHIAVAFNSKEIMIYDSNGEFLNHIKIKNSEHFFIDYRDGSEHIDIFFARNHRAVLISEDGKIIEEYEYLERDIEDRRAAGNKFTKTTEDFIYTRESSFRFPITTYSSKLVQIDRATGEEKVIFDNPWVSIKESVGLVCVILVFGSIILMMGFKIVKCCVKYLLQR